MQVGHYSQSMDFTIITCDHNSLNSKMCFVTLLSTRQCDNELSFGNRASGCALTAAKARRSPPRHRRLQGRITCLAAASSTWSAFGAPCVTKWIPVVIYAGARIEAIWEQSTGEKMFVARWYIRPEQTCTGRQVRFTLTPSGLAAAVCDNKRRGPLRGSWCLHLIGQPCV
eukprot:scaffold475991_cov17-Prasinocladus_malaysianus.AAC.1